MGRDAWADHCQSHLQNLPYRCDLQIFRKVIAHPGLCPACLGQESWASEKRMTQFCQYNTWLKHLQSHLRGPLRAGGHCRHPRCHDSAPLATSSDLEDHWINIHRIPGDIFSTRNASKPGTKRSRPTVDSSDEYSGGPGPGAPELDSFVSYTAESFKRKRKGNRTCLPSHGADKMYDQHGHGQEDNSTLSMGHVRSDQCTIASVAHDETLHSSADDSSARQESREHVLSCSLPTSYDTDDGGSVDRDTDSDVEWEVEAITDSKVDTCRGFLYRVVWVGDWKDSWEAPAMLSCPDLLEDFHRCNPEKPSPEMEDRLEEE